MNGSQLYDLVTALLDGDEISTTTFETLINMAKLKRESKRDWQVLKKKSAAFSITPSTTNSTAFTLPSDFLRCLKNTKYSSAMVLLNSAGKKTGDAVEVLFERQYDYMDTPGYFFVDFPNRSFYLTGNPVVSEARTAYMFYIKSSPAITYVPEAGQGWDAFKDATTGMDFSPILAYDVAKMQKGDIDFDDINARMVQFMNVSIDDLEFAMNVWDDRMKLSALQV